MWGVLLVMQVLGKSRCLSHGLGSGYLVEGILDLHFGFLRD